jgi:peptidoglycan-associated lipoprotein
MSVTGKTAGLLSLCLVLSLGVAACGKKPPPAVPQPEPPAVAPPTPPPPPPPPAPPPPAPTAPALSEEELFARKTLAELNAERPLGDVFFDLDGFSIRDEGRAVLQKNAEWMKRWGATRISIEGHCDERGTPEYNLALGERRAVAVRDYLVSLGVDASRVQTLSKGKEAPFCSESSESCWQQNRRGHFLVTAK